jgi:hypothetical protein
MKHPEPPKAFESPACPGLRHLSNPATIRTGPGWFVALCAVALLAWSMQGAAGWFKPHSDIGLSQFTKFDPAHTPRTAWQESSSVTRLESKPEPAALPAAGNTPSDPGAIHAAFAASTGIRLEHRALTLPAIRAPPQTNSST